MRLILAAILGSALFIGACKKKDNDEGEPAGQSGSATLKFNHNWEGSANPLHLDSMYVNSVTGDTLTLVTLKYYITNIRLKTSGGTWFAQPDSYFLVDMANPSSAEINISGIPAGDYTDLEFTFGVDSAKNVSGAQAGALSPGNGMFWSWNTGYIMSKAEGISPNSNTGSFAFHLGGFEGPNSVVTKKQVNLSGLNTLNVTSGSSGQIGISTDVMKMWEGSPSISVVDNLQSTGTAAKTMATAFVGGMTLGYIVD